MHEIFPEFARTKFPRLGRVLGLLAQIVERWARSRADLTVTVTRPIDALLAARPINRTEHRIILHNTADPADFGEGRERRVVVATPRERVLKLVYHGTLTPLYGLDVAIRATGIARATGLPVHLSIIGNGPERPRLRELIQTLGLSNDVRLEMPIPQTALPARLGECDAGVVPTRLNGMTQYSLSTKLLEYVHLGLPVLAARLPTYLAYLGWESAWYWDPDSPPDLARAIRDFATSSPEEVARRAWQAHERLKSIAWPTEQERLLAAYKALLTS
jgi:glycosyltransferase involved in cell wall biosynthesis